MTHNLTILTWGADETSHWKVETVIFEQTSILQINEAVFPEWEKKVKIVRK